ncbi:MAG: hypothetical protein AAFO82_13000 [Bacteroidota bacterium]
MNHSIVSNLGGRQSIVLRPPKFLWVFCFLPFISFAQLGEKVIQLQAKDEQTAKEVRSISYPVNPSKPHTLYLHPDWALGWVTLKKDSTIYPVMARFNILTGAIEVKWQEQIRMLRANAVEMAMVGTHILIPNKSSPSNYYELLSYGKLNLLCAFELTYTYEGSNVLTSSINGEKKNNFKSVFFYYEEGEKISSLKTNKKKVLEVMKNAAEAKQFIEAENLKLSRKEDLVKLFDSYNDKLN